MSGNPEFPCSAGRISGCEWKVEQNCVSGGIFGWNGLRLMVRCKCDRRGFSGATLDICPRAPIMDSGWNCIILYARIIVVNFVTFV
jgi:hypothetical protein